MEQHDLSRRLTIHGTVPQMGGALEQNELESSQMLGHPSISDYIN